MALCRTVFLWLAVLCVALANTDVLTEDANDQLPEAQIQNDNDSESLETYNENEINSATQSSSKSIADYNLGSTTESSVDEDVSASQNAPENVEESKTGDGISSTTEASTGYTGPDNDQSKSEESSQDSEESKNIHDGAGPPTTIDSSSTTTADWDNLQESEGDNDDISQSETELAVTPKLDQHIETDVDTASNATTTHEQKVIRIIVVGRSGYGVSSTIRKLIGTLTKCDKPEGTETLQNIYEYTISSIPSTDFHIKLLDVPGFVDSRTLEQESELLATMKSYVTKTGHTPDFIMALAGFDDNRFVGAHSPFVQLLKRIELFKNNFLSSLPDNKKMNIIFLLTRLMSETKVNQRKPSKKLGNFRKVINDFTSLPQPYHIVVGDNHAHSEHGAKIEGGYYLLPNRQHYPKNIWEAMIRSTTPEEDDDPTEELQIKEVLKAIMNNREVEMKCEAQFIQTDWAEYKTDGDAFLYFLQQGNRTIEQSSVNNKIQEVFEGRSKIPDQVNGIIQKTALQLYLQNENITEIEADIPSSSADRGAFFQKSSLVTSTIPASLLNDAFGLEMPEYIQPLTVGYGYDVLADELSLETIFKGDEIIPSPIGYQLPKFMKCRKLPIHDNQNFQSYSQNISDYFEERLKHLNFEMKENITLEKFTGKVKDGYNLAPEEGVDIATMTAAKEVRTLKCLLAEKENWGDLREEFLETIDALRPVDLTNKDSITEWKIFFGKYGTHIVVQGYGGGKLVGSIVGTNVKKAYESQSVIDDTLNSILKFTPFSVDGLEKPSYQLFAGEIGEAAVKVSQLYELPEAERNQILVDWEKSLNSNFEMLKHEFSLERISTIVKEKIGEKKGRMVDQALELFLQGELKRQRKPSTSSSSRGSKRKEKSNNSRASDRSSTAKTGQVGYPNNAHQSNGNELSTPKPIQSQYAPTSPSLYQSSTINAFKPNKALDDIHEQNIARMREQIAQDKIAFEARLESQRRIAEEADRKHQEHMAWLEAEAAEARRRDEEERIRLAVEGERKRQERIKRDEIKRNLDKKMYSDEKWFDERIKVLRKQQQDALDAAEHRANFTLGMEQRANETEDSLSQNTTKIFKINFDFDECNQNILDYVVQMKREARERHQDFMRKLEGEKNEQKWPFSWFD